MKNEAESQAVFAVSYVRNIRGRAMLPDSTVCTRVASDFNLSSIKMVKIMFGIKLNLEIILNITP